MRLITPRPRRIAATSAILTAVWLLPMAASPAQAASPRMHLDCATGIPFCTEVHDSEQVFGEDVYVGHDEPSTLFYSNEPGSGNNQTYLLRLPKDPPVKPNNQGTGGTFTFQLRATFWFGMAMCDNQSAPSPSSTPCTPDSDANIFDSADPGAPDYIGKHPGTAFMEMQFYPPGYVAWPPGNSCDATRWCAALNIDSLSENLNTGQLNNSDCRHNAGNEPVNFAFITRNGVPHAPPDPLHSTLATFTPDPRTDLFMNSGDQLAVALHDTTAGFQVNIADLTSGRVGSMTASAANGFGQVVFDPSAATCSTLPYSFHPMYSTSSEHTRVPWAAHSYNVAFADEIGHFESCLAVAAEGGPCTQAGWTEPDGQLDGDNGYCFSGATSTRIDIGGCYDTENDFDGTSYRPDWPGTLNLGQDTAKHAQSVLFSSPVFNGLHRYSRVAFEADLPRIEAADTIDPRVTPCNRLTGDNCVNPPPGAQFYPLFTTRAGLFGCLWQEGGTGIPGTVNTFGGSSTTEFGTLLQSVYPGVGGTAIYRYNNFRRILATNPC